MVLRLPVLAPNLWDLRRVYVDVLIDTFCENNYSSPTDADIVQMELDAELKNLQYAIGNALVNGTGATILSPPHGLHFAEFESLMAQVRPIATAVGRTL